MTVDEFFDWLENEPDAHELVDGRPVRLPDAKQGGRRIGEAFRAAELVLGRGRGRGTDWVMEPSSLFGGREPFSVAAEDWAGVVAVIEALRGIMAKDTARDSRDRERLDALLERAVRLAAVQRARHDQQGNP